jgi:hypothetical protein
MVVGVNLSMCVVHYYSDIRLSRLTRDVFIALMGYNSVSFGLSVWLLQIEALLFLLCRDMF